MFLYSYIDPYITGNVQFTDALSYDIRRDRRSRTACGERAQAYGALCRPPSLCHGSAARAPMVKFDHTVVEGARRRNHRIRTNKPSPTHHNGYARS